MSTKRIKNIITRNLSQYGSKLVALSELPVIGNIDDPEGFFDNVIENGDNITKHLTAYTNVPVDEKTINKINENIAYLGYEVEFK